MSKLMDDIPGTTQDKPIGPTTLALPPENLTPILLPPHIIQLYLSMRAPHDSPLIESQPTFRGWKRILWVRQIRN